MSLLWGFGPRRRSFDGAFRRSSPPLPLTLPFFFPLFSLLLAVPSRKPAAQSSKSIATQCGQMTTRLVWRPTSFRNMWPSLLNWRQCLWEKIFPRTKSDLAAGGLPSCEWAASKTAQTEENTLFFSTQVTLMHLPPLQAMHHPLPWQRLQNNLPLPGWACARVC